MSFLCLVAAMDTNVTLVQAVSILYLIPFLILVCTVCYLALAHRAKAKRPMWQAIVLLRRNDDDLGIQSIVILWIAITAIAASAWLFLILRKDIASLPIPYTSLISAASAIIAAFGIAFTFVVGSEQSTRNARQQLYQTLEIQSILLFRFESDNHERVQSLWFADEPPKEKTLERFLIKQYICQILNLFEMATRFQIQGVLPRDVFGSWVIWMWELCKCPVFRDFWLGKDDLPFNYVGELRAIITAGVAIAKHCHCENCETIQRQYFFDAVSRELHSPEISNWFDETDDVRLLRVLRENGPAQPTAT